MSVSTHALDFKGEIGRKALHLLALVVPASMLILPFPVALGGLVALSIAAVATEVARSFNEPVSLFIDRYFGWMMRPEERGMGKGFTGATWVVVTAALLLGAFEPRFAAAGMSMTLVGDAAAALFGRTWGTHKWPGSNRTLLGTGAFVVTALVVAAFFPSIPWSARAAAAVGAALAEVLPLRINDNLLLPFVAAGLLTLLAA